MSKTKGITIAFILTAAAFCFLVAMIGQEADRILQENNNLRQAVKASVVIHLEDSSRIEKLTVQVDTIREQLREREKSGRGGDRLPQLTSLGTYTLTAYCGCEKCCGKWARKRNGEVKGAAGIELIPGVSVAAPLPLGTELVINGHRYIVQDTTADWIVDRYGGRIVDIYFADHEPASEFGKQQAEVYVIND